MIQTEDISKDFFEYLKDGLWYKSIRITSKDASILERFFKIDCLIEFRAWSKTISPESIASLPASKAARDRISDAIAIEATRPWFKDNMREHFALPHAVEKRLKKGKNYTSIPGYVYAFWSCRASLYKIGFSENVTTRLSSMRIACPDFEIIFTRKGTGLDEGAIHDLLSDYCVGGECFAANLPEIRAAFDLILPE